MDVVVHVIEAALAGMRRHRFRGCGCSRTPGARRPNCPFLTRCSGTGVRRDVGERLLQSLVDRVDAFLADAIGSHGLFDHG